MLETAVTSLALLSYQLKSRKLIELSIQTHDVNKSNANKKGERSAFRGFSSRMNSELIQFEI